MKIGIVLIFSMAVGAFISHLLLKDIGYVLIEYLDYSIETSFPFVLILFLMLYFIIRTLARFIFIPKKIILNLESLKNKKNNNKLNLAVKYFFEGSWAKAEKIFSNTLESSDMLLIKFLLAARAANSQGLTNRRDEWLRLAYENVPNSKSAILLTKAELQYNNKDYEGALATLENYRDGKSNHPLGIELLAKTYNSLQDWDSLISIAARISNAEIDKQVKVSIVKNALNRLGTKSNLTAKSLDLFIGGLSNSIRSEPGIVAPYAILLGKLGLGDKAEQILSKAISKKWDNDLVLSYGLIRSSKLDNQLHKSERWLENHPESVNLLLTCGRLCMALELWGKAKKYLAAIQTIDDTKLESYQLYGLLLKNLGDCERACEVYRKGIESSIRNMEKDY